MGSMEEEDDGREVSVEDLRAWSALAPFRGQIVECRLDHTNLSGATGWAAFLILQVSNRLDGSIVLYVPSFWDAKMLEWLLPWRLVSTGGPTPSTYACPLLVSTRQKMACPAPIFMPQ